jgi:hypothetical protein
VDWRVVLLEPVLYGVVGMGAEVADFDWGVAFDMVGCEAFLTVY